MLQVEIWKQVIQYELKKIFEPFTDTAKDSTKINKTNWVKTRLNN